MRSYAWQVPAFTKKNAYPYALHKNSIVFILSRIACFDVNVARVNKCAILIVSIPPRERCIFNMGMTNAIVPKMGRLEYQLPCKNILEVKEPWGVNQSGHISLICDSTEDNCPMKHFCRFGGIDLSLQATLLGEQQDLQQRSSEIRYFGRHFI